MLPSVVGYEGDRLEGPATQASAAESDSDAPFGEGHDKAERSRIVELIFWYGVPICGVLSLLFYLLSFFLSHFSFSLVS